MILFMLGAFLCGVLGIVAAILYGDARRSELRGPTVSDEQRAVLQRDLARIRAKYGMDKGEQ